MNTKLPPLAAIVVCPAISLHEYRLRHPRSALVPTITQSGLLRLLLEQQQRKTARLARRRAARRRMAARNWQRVSYVWRAITRGSLRGSHTAVPPSVANEGLTQTAPRRAALNP